MVAKSGIVRPGLVQALAQSGPAVAQIAQDMVVAFQQRPDRPAFTPALYNTPDQRE